MLWHPWHIVTALTPCRTPSSPLSFLLSSPLLSLSSSPLLTLPPFVLAVSLAPLLCRCKSSKARAADPSTQMSTTQITRCPHPHKSRGLPTPIALFVCHWLPALPPFCLLQPSHARRMGGGGLCGRAAWVPPCPANMVVESTMPSVGQGWGGGHVHPALPLEGPTHPSCPPQDCPPVWARTPAMVPPAGARTPAVASPGGAIVPTMAR